MDISKKIKLFCKNEGITLSQLAKDVGVTSVSMSRYLSGKRIPEEGVMDSFIEVTKGKITPNDFYGVK